MNIKVDILVILALVVFVLVFIVIKRNKKDRKDLEKELNARELKSDKHDEEHI